MIMAFKSQAPRASLAPEGHSVGGQVPDGDYEIISSTTGLNTYAGNVPEGVPAIVVVYRDPSSEYTQYYKAGDNEHLAPTDDAKGFIHPDGKSPAKIYGGGAASLWLKSLAEAGFEIKDGDDGVGQFEGLRVTLRSKAAPKGKTSDNPDRVIPLVVKILGTATVGGIKRPSAGIKPTGSNSDGIHAATVALIKEALEKAPEHTLPLPKLAMNVWMAAGKDPAYKDSRSEIKALVNAKWIEGRSEFATDGETVGLA